MKATGEYNGILDCTATVSFGDTTDGMIMYSIIIVGSNGVEVATINNYLIEYNEDSGILEELALVQFISSLGPLMFLVRE